MPARVRRESLVGSARRALSGLALLLVLPLVPSGCGGVEGEQPTRPQSRPRSADPRLLEARAALEEGSLGVAASLIEQLGAQGGFEGALLAARVEALSGDPVEALRQIEIARGLDETDPRSFATAAEIYCAMGRLEAADAEIQRGIEAAGERGPELSRAYGVLAISNPGNAKLGVALLEDALAADPELPFVRIPLSRGKEQVARGAIGAEEYAAADALLAEALALVPGEPIARETRAELRLAERRFDDAVELYEGLLAEDVQVREQLLNALRASAADALIANDRDLQVKRYLRMRELGVPMADMGFGRVVLERRAEELADAGFETFQRAEVTPVDLDAEDFSAAVARREREFARAETMFRNALDCDAGSPKARHGLGLALFRQGHYTEAAVEWQGLANAFAGEDLPFPLHLDLARALFGAERGEEAREVLGEYLGDHPGGRWVDQTQELADTFE